MIRKGPWKYLYHVDAPRQLFNLESDSEELVDRVTTEAEVVAGLHRELLAVCDPEEENRCADRR